jgi:hypothetical protein
VARTVPPRITARSSHAADASASRKLKPWAERVFGALLRLVAQRPGLHGVTLVRAQRQPVAGVPVLVVLMVCMVALLRACMDPRSRRGAVMNGERPAPRCGEDGLEVLLVGGGAPGGRRRANVDRPLSRD